MKAASTTTKIDILLTHVTPASLTLHTPNMPPSYPDRVSPQLDDVVRAAMPRYHFVSGAGMFWEREPFPWPDAVDTGRCTRFLSIGAFGGQVPEGQKRPRVSKLIKCHLETDSGLVELRLQYRPCHTEYPAYSAPT